MMINRLIESDIKTKRFDMEEPIYAGCWAFMRELRLHNKTKRIYPVDPYAEVYTFRDNMYGIFQENIDGKGDVWSYLIVGPEKAMLIDTAFGLGNLKGLCDELTSGKPLIVVNTHFHPDHAGGNPQFGKVYALQEDAEKLRESMGRPILNEKIMNPDGTCRYVKFDPADLIEAKPYEIIDIGDGYRFDLGEGYIVEAMRLAGHTKGQAAFIDHYDRTLFPGDDIIAMRIGIGGSMEDLAEFRDRMKLLAARTDEFDGIFPGHFVVDLDSFCVKDVADTLDQILSNPEAYDYTEVSGKGVTYCKCVKGLGVIGYHMDK
jgi:glyoxylase-like metal-dependent hydrolase (beta-lactamase superfamily II)